MTFANAKCHICSAELTVHQRFRGGLCDDWRCQEAVLKNDLEMHREQAAKALGVENPGKRPIFVVPRNDRRITKLARHRREKFRDHLRRIVAAAADRTPPGDLDDEEPISAKPLPEPENGLLGQACAACRGYCCQHGKEHAFLEEDRMGRYMSAAPHESPEQVIEHYLSYLPESSFEEACVYQSATGCALPREMRARICNAYQCSGLKTYRRHLESQGPAEGFAVIREDNQIIRSAFLGQESLRRYGPSPDQAPRDNDPRGGTVRG